MDQTYLINRLRQENAGLRLTNTRLDDMVCELRKQLAWHVDKCKYIRHLEAKLKKI